MKIRISNHAEFRMIERGIDPEKARLTVKYPTLLNRQNDGSIEFQREFEDRILGVVCVQINASILLIKTAYYIV